MTHSGTIYIILEWSYCCLCFLFVVNRVRVKTFRTHPDLSDAFVVSAWIINAAWTVADTTLYSRGLLFDDAIYDSETGSESAEYFWKVFYVENIMCYTPLYLIKGAFICLYLEITPPDSKRIRQAIWVGAVMCCIGYLYTTIQMIFPCKPIRAFWDNSLLHKLPHACDTFEIQGYVWISVHVFTDIYLYAIPFFLLRHMPPMVSKGRKAAMYAMFGAGFIVVLLACSQLPSFVTTEESFFFSMHEQNAAITVACLPTLRITMNRLMERSRRNDDEMACRLRRGSTLKIRRGILDTREVAEGRLHAEVDDKREVVNVGVSCSSLSSPRTGSESCSV